MTIKINLALQGGGAHGAFTWGVLDRLLQDEEIEFAAISGTSAGALNAAALKAGLLAGGRDGARANLNWFWEQIGAVTDDRWQSWLTSGGVDTAFFAKSLERSPFYQAFDLTTSLMSPYIYGPALRNPLERIVRNFRFDDICCEEGPQLHICATNVRSGKIRIFGTKEVSPEALMASACLPNLFQAVEIADPDTGQMEAYWDGGYTGNPALFPLYDKNLPDDVLIVNINPLYREDVPTDGTAIRNRINEISFNSSLLRELRAIDFVKRLLSDQRLPEGSMKNVLVHMISDDALMNELNVATKSIATPVILAKLKAAGIAAADTFLATHKNSLNRRSTVDLEKMFN